MNCTRTPVGECFLNSIVTVDDDPVVEILAGTYDPIADDVRTESVLEFPTGNEAMACLVGDELIVPVIERGGHCIGELTIPLEVLKAAISKLEELKIAQDNYNDGLFDNDTFTSGGNDDCAAPLVVNNYVHLMTRQDR